MNKHLKLLEVCKEIGYDFNNSNFIIQIDNNWIMTYWKKQDWTILTNRSSTEIIFKPNFMSKLRIYLEDRYWNIKADKIIIRLAWILQADKFLYWIINWSIWS